MAFWFVVAGIVCCIKAITYLSDMGDVLKALEALEQLGLSVAKGKFKIYLELVFIIALAINFFVLAYMAYKAKEKNESDEVYQKNNRIIVEKINEIVRLINKIGSSQSKEKIKEVNIQRKVVVPLHKPSMEELARLTEGTTVSHLLLGSGIITAINRTSGEVTITFNNDGIGVVSRTFHYPQAFIDGAFKIE